MQGLLNPAFLPATEDVPTYFLPMLNDTDRNIAYDAAIRATIELFKKQEGRAPKVLDLGSGSGLLSLISLHHGAEHVTLVEANETLAQISRKQLAKSSPSEEEDEEAEVAEGGEEGDTNESVADAESDQGDNAEASDAAAHNDDGEKSDEGEEAEDDDAAAGEEEEDSDDDADGKRWTVINALSTDLLAPAKGGVAYDMIVCELLGSMINSESMYVYVWDLLMRGVITNFGTQAVPKFYVVPNSGEMTVRAYRSAEAVGVQTGLSYASMGTIYANVYDAEPTPTITWVQDESMRLCLSASKWSPVSQPIQVLKEQYDAVSGAVRHPRKVELTIEGDTKEMILVLEWTVKLSEEVTLYHTLEHVSALSHSVQLARWINWGFLFTPLDSCIPCSSTTTAATTTSSSDEKLSTSKKSFTFTVTYSPADLVFKSEAAEPSTGVSSSTANLQTSTSTSTATVEGVRLVAAPSSEASTPSSAAGGAASAITATASMTTTGAGSSNGASKKRRIMPVSLEKKRAKTSAQTEEEILSHKQLSMIIIATKLAQTEA